MSSNLAKSSKDDEMSKGRFGSSDTFSGGDVASGASGSHEQDRAQNLGLPSTILIRPSIHSIVSCS